MRQQQPVIARHLLSVKPMLSLATFRLMDAVNLPCATLAVDIVPDNVLVDIVPLEPLCRLWELRGVALWAEDVAIRVLWSEQVV
jgi:hypothetical protein